MVAYEENPRCGWDDLGYLGIVIEWVRTVEPDGRVSASRDDSLKKRSSLYTSSMTDIVRFDRLTTYMVGKA
jgi:hypothetical protein